MSCAEFYTPPCSVSGPKYQKRQSKQNFEQVSWLTSSKARGSIWSRDLVPQSHHYKTLLQFGRDTGRNKVQLGSFYKLVTCVLKCDQALLWFVT